ncbi:MAG: RraA family protein [Proteobacteria bacterium]|jgi:4-hydroxy-4-methyl-2-oxoglutarate aldolase|nr:RraA family protein [Pseudomonadota bacterium]
MDAELRQALLELDCASLADADKALRVMDVGLRAINTGVKLVGVARTVRCHEDFLAVIRALDAAVPGEVLVVDTQGSSRAVVGELFSMEAARRGLAGIIVDGPVRDVSTLRKLALPVYARGLCPMSGTIRELGALQVPVVCGGVAVKPGDIVVGDDDGLIVASAAEFRALLAAARAIEARETVVRARLDAGHDLISMITLAEHVDALQRGEPSKLAFKLDD